MTGTFNSKGRTILLVASACAAFVVVVIIVLAFAGRSKVSVQEFDALQQRVLALEARVEKHSLTMDGLDQMTQQNDVFQQFVNEAAKREADFMFRLSDIETKLGISPPAPGTEPQQVPGTTAATPPKPPAPPEPKAVTAPAPAPKPAAKPAPPAPPQPESAVNGYYKVKPGDTAYSISRRFGLTVDQLKEINGLSNSDIYPGQNLRVTP
ncbi:MAG: LysM peptidoglycan-binding domain-containing protein [Thermodesulfobacteriota bacterium]